MTVVGDGWSVCVRIENKFLGNGVEVAIDYPTGRINQSADVLPPLR